MSVHHDGTDDEESRRLALAAQLCKCAHLITTTQQARSDPLIIDTLAKFICFCYQGDAFLETSSATIAAVASAPVTQTSSSKLNGHNHHCRCCFETPKAGSSTNVLARGWMKLQQRRHQGSLEWKFVHVSLVQEGGCQSSPSSSQDRTLYVQKEDQGIGNETATSTLLDASNKNVLHRLPVKWIEKVSAVDCIDDQFSIHVKLLNRDFCFQCPKDALAAQSWIASLLSAKQDAVNTESKAWKGAQHAPNSSAEPAASSAPTTAPTLSSPRPLPTKWQERERIKELQRIAGRAGIETKGMNRQELEAVVQRYQQFLKERPARQRSVKDEKQSSRDDPSTHSSSTSKPTNNLSNKETANSGLLGKTPITKKHEGSQENIRQSPVTDTQEGGLADTANRTYTPQTTTQCTNPNKERIKELRKLAHGAGINTHGMELDELENVISDLSRQHQADQAKRNPFMSAKPTTADLPLPTPTTAPPPITAKKERINELRKLAHGAGINTHGMELNELEQTIANLARQHNQAKSKSPSTFVGIPVPHDGVGFGDKMPSANSIPQNKCQSTQEPRRPTQDSSRPQTQHSTFSTENKYAHVAHQQELKSVEQGIKREILIHWALQPPAFQALRPIEALLASIHIVLPPAFGIPGHEHFKKWDPVSALELGCSKHVEKKMKRLRFLLHEDRLPNDFGPEQTFLCRLLWDVTSDAFEAHKRLQAQP